MHYFKSLFFELHFYICLIKGELIIFILYSTNESDSLNAIKKLLFVFSQKILFKLRVPITVIAGIKEQWINIVLIVFD